MLITAYERSQGVDSLTRQLYWQHRSQKLKHLADQSGDPKQFYEDLVRELDEAESVARRRTAGHAWIGAAACLLGWVLSYIFFRFAIVAQVRGDTASYTYWTCSVLCLASGFYGFITAKRNSF